MRKDSKLILLLLFDKEGEEKVDLSKYTRDQINYHKAQLIYEGLAEGPPPMYSSRSSKNRDIPIIVHISRLTSKGHQLIDEARNNKIECLRIEGKESVNGNMMSIEGILEILESYSLTQEQTSILIGVQHDRIVEAFNTFLFHHRSLFGLRGWSDVTQGLRDAGVDSIWQYSIKEVTSKIGIQVKSHGDFSKNDDSFRKTVLSQITDSHRINLNRLLLLLGADLTDPSQREKARGITSDIQQMNENYVITISPEKVAGLWRWNEGLNVDAINQMEEAGYPWLITISDTVGNINHNSWGKNSSGNWTKIKRTTLYVGEKIRIQAIANYSEIDSIQFRFSVHPSGGGFQTRREWDNCQEWEWTIGESDIGRGVCVMVSVRREKQYYQFQDKDDYTYAIYDILPKKI